VFYGLAKGYGFGGLLLLAAVPCLRRGTWNAGEARSIAYVLVDVKTSVLPIAKHVLGSTEKKVPISKVANKIKM
jgi:hypothetical protein